MDLSDLIGGWSGSKVVELLELQTLSLNPPASYVIDKNMVRA